jgi:hypothetical protein
MTTYLDYFPLFGEQWGVFLENKKNIFYFAEIAEFCSAGERIRALLAHTFLFTFLGKIKTMSNSDDINYELTLERIRLSVSTSSPLKLGIYIDTYINTYVHMYLSGIFRKL